DGGRGVAAFEEGDEGRSGDGDDRSEKEAGQPSGRAERPEHERKERQRPPPEVEGMRVGVHPVPEDRKGEGADEEEAKQNSQPGREDVKADGNEEEARHGSPLSPRCVRSNPNFPALSGVAAAKTLPSAPPCP